VLHGEEAYATAAIGMRPFVPNPEMHPETAKESAQMLLEGGE
jgi:hypothetical protein